MITGSLSILSKRYEPPCKSKPRLIFLFTNSSSNSVKFEIVKKITIIDNKVVIKILILENLSTLFSKLFFYFLSSK